MTDKYRKSNASAGWGKLGLCLSIPPSLLFWGLPVNAAPGWMARILFPAIALISLILLLRRGNPLDEHEHDYLSRCFGYRKFFRDGFQFAFAMAAPNGVCCIELWYQNSRSAPCRACVGIVPVSSFLQRKQGEVILFNVDCGPGEFGVIRFPFPDANQIRHECLWKVGEVSPEFDCDLQHRCTIATLKQ